jgi:hypothetical protein
MRQRRWTAGMILTSLVLAAVLLGGAAGNRLHSQPAAAQTPSPGTWRAISFEAGQPQAALAQGNAFLAGLDPRCQVAPSLAAASDPPTFVFVVAYRC